MKKNWMQVLSLTLSVILLAAVVKQGQRIEELSAQLDAAQSELSGEVRNVPYQISSQIQEANRLVEDCQLEPAGIDRESGTLLAVLSVTLKTWREDTVLTASYAMGETRGSVPMSPTGPGVFTAPLSLPVEQERLSLSLLISQDGAHTQEDLGAYGSISMLLPLRVTGSGWSGPTYQNGTLESQFDVVVENPYQTKISGQTFRIYLNGTLTQEVGAEISETSSTGSEDSVAYAPALPEQTWNMKCGPDDAVRITFLCQDGYGLGYEFPVVEWTAEDASPSGRWNSEVGNSDPVLTWPK